MAFTSAATNLIPTDSKSAVDVFMRDMCIGAEAACTRSTERISLASDGLQANGASSEPLVGLPMDRGCAPSTQRISLTSTGQQIVGKPSTQPGHMRWDGEVVLFVTAADSVVPDDTSGVEDVFMRGACHDTTTCVTTTTRLSVAEQGLQGNGASFAPRGTRCLDRTGLGDVLFDRDQLLARHRAGPVRRSNFQDRDALAFLGTARTARRPSAIVFSVTG